LAHAKGISLKGIRGIVLCLRDDMNGFIGHGIRGNGECEGIACFLVLFPVVSYKEFFNQKNVLLLD
jgi:hypothetical protein